jgi:hypothetical protein
MQWANGPCAAARHSTPNLLDGVHGGGGVHLARMDSGCITRPLASPTMCTIRMGVCSMTEREQSLCLVNRMCSVRQVELAGPHDSAGGCV